MQCSDFYLTFQIVICYPVTSENCNDVFSLVSLSCSDNLVIGAVPTVPCKHDQLKTHINIKTIKYRCQSSKRTYCKRKILTQLLQKLQHEN